jgi:serine/threonine-protein kinase
VARLLSEQRERWGQGDRVRVEAFLEKYPFLREAREELVALILGEMHLREANGELPCLEDYLRRFPKQADLLQKRLGLACLLDTEGLPTQRLTADPDVHQREEDTPPLPLPASGGGRLIVGNYEILGQLGHGGMGVVYRARDLRLGRVVALKMIRAGALALPHEMERFHREARAMALLDHPHIVPIYDNGEYQGLPYFTMKLITGGSLADRLGGPRADPRWAAALLEKVARAVHYLHECKILHRDLKPINILLDENQQPYVSDFGLAKVLDADIELTLSGVVLGTLPYMAPEQADGRSERITAASDIWALGVILYELLTGQRPFAAKGREELSRQILTGEPARPHWRRPAVDSALEAIVLRCLAKEPARRYVSAAALADDLQRWLNREPIQARSTRWPRRLGATVSRLKVPSPAVILLGIVALLVAMLAATRSVENGVSAVESPGQRLQAEFAVLQREFAEKGTVTLLGATGGPRVSCWTFDSAEQPLSPAPDIPFCFASPFEISLLQLMPDPQCPHYKFQVEVRHDQSDIGTAGIYFGWYHHDLPQGAEHWFCEVDFADRGELAEVFFGQGFPAGQFPQPGQRPEFGRVSLNCHRRVPTGRGRGQDSVHSGLTARLFTSAEHDGRPSDWRTLAVEVTPAQVCVSWENEPLPPVTRAQLLELARFMDMEFVPWGGLGLYVNCGKASFRNGTLVRLR